MTYPEFQLAKARAVLTQSTPNAKGRVKDWASVIAGIASGVLRIGERKVLKDAPVWATPKVLHGGFASGELLAAGALSAYEEQLLATLTTNDVQASDVSSRARINAFFLSAPGWAQLQQLLHSQNYQLELPEHGALLAIVTLFQQAHAAAQSDMDIASRQEGERAQAIAQQALADILPWCHQLRFYPTPSAPTAKVPTP
jgi:hypothetical protein